VYRDRTLEYNPSMSRSFFCRDSPKLFVASIWSWETEICGSHQYKIFSFWNVCLSIINYLSTLYHGIYSKALSKVCFFWLS